MRLLLIPILLTSTALPDTYIKNSVITNSVIGDNFSSTGRSSSSSLVTKNITPKAKFSKIEISFPAKLTIQKSSISDIKLRIDKNFKDNILFKVYNDTLHIEVDGTINTRLKTEIVVGTQYLDMLKVGSTTAVYIKGFNLSTFNLFVSGTAKVTFLSGHIDNLSLRSEGTSRISLEKIDINRATIVSKGTSRTTINVNEFLNVNLSAISKVKYFGNPRIKKKIKALGKLIKIN